MPPMPCGFSAKVLRQPADIQSSLFKDDHMACWQSFSRNLDRLPARFLLRKRRAGSDSGRIISVHVGGGAGGGKHAAR
jgi:hypothetical protein